MKSTLLLLFAVCSHNLIAQITLHQNLNAPIDGTTYDYVVAYGDDVGEEIGIFNMDFGGPNSNWDLSSISGETIPSTFGDASNGSDSEFSNSDLVHFMETPVVTGERYISVENQDYFYDGLSVYIPGDDEPFVRTTYEDKRQFMTYPLTYLGEFNDAFTAVVEISAGDQVLNQTGNVSLIADGYGSVTLPYGTIDNVLRVKLISGYFNDFMGVTITSFSDYQYFWYHEEYQTIIASYEEFYTDGLLEERVASYITEEDFTSLVQNYSQPKISIFPNPSEGRVSVDFPDSELYDYSVLDSQGKEVLNGNTKNSFNNELILDGFESGVYILHASNSTNNFTQRFIIE